MQVMYKSALPWTLRFSFARTIQQSDLDIRGGKEKNTVPAHRALYHRAKCDYAARHGEYNMTMETI
jgi:fructose-bisphosphate aldolase class I